MHLYRVQDKGSRARFDDQGNLCAKGDGPSTREGFQEEIKNHLSWGRSKAPSCFISVFDNEEQAWRWAERRIEKAKGPAIVYRIDASDAWSPWAPDSPRVYPISRMLEELGVEREAFVTNGEHVILNKVCSAKIELVGVVSAWETPAGQTNESLSLLRQNQKIHGVSRVTDPACCGHQKRKMEALEKVIRSRVDLNCKAQHYQVMTGVVECLPIRSH